MIPTTHILIVSTGPDNPGLSRYQGYMATHNAALHRSTVSPDSNPALLPFVDRVRRDTNMWRYPAPTISSKRMTQLFSLLETTANTRIKYAVCVNPRLWFQPWTTLDQNRHLGWIPAEERVAVYAEGRIPRYWIAGSELQPALSKHGYVLGRFDVPLCVELEPLFTDVYDILKPQLAARDEDFVVLLGTDFL